MWCFVADLWGVWSGGAVRARITLCFCWTSSDMRIWLRLWTCFNKSRRSTAKRRDDNCDEFSVFLSDNIINKDLSFLLSKFAALTSTCSSLHAESSHIISTLAIDCVPTHFFSAVIIAPWPASLLAHSYAWTELSTSSPAGKDPRADPRHACDRSRRDPLDPDTHCRSPTPTELGRSSRNCWRWRVWEDARWVSWGCLDNL